VAQQVHFGEMNTITLVTFAASSQAVFNVRDGVTHVLVKMRQGLECILLTMLIHRTGQHSVLPARRIVMSTGMIGGKNTIQKGFELFADIAD